MEHQLDAAAIDRYARISSQYDCIESFLKKHERMNYVEFDYYTINDLTLFSVEPDFDFTAIETVTDQIVKIIPAIKRIFSKPILHLKEMDEILPIESVRVINNGTIQHLSNHYSLWANIKDDGIEPRKLLSRTYQDNYGIYENLVFCDTVDDILSFTRKSLWFLKDLIYSNRSIEVDLLERVNHLNYFLALGKLHTGYIRNFDKVFRDAKEYVNKLLYIYNSIQPRLKRPVYRLNKNRTKGLKLHKTNILGMQKDYHQVFTFAKSYESYGFKSKKKRDFDLCKLDSVANNYFDFCQIMTLFAIGHFNFSCDYHAEICLRSLEISFAFKDWVVEVRSADVKGQRAIVLEVSKDVRYKIALIPDISVDPTADVEALKRALKVDEALICSPYEDEAIAHSYCFLSISNIESFRRLQQLLLRGMIYADLARKDCPFCYSGLTHVKDTADGEKIYVCETCRTRIVDTKCHKTRKDYSYTTILNYRVPNLEKEQYREDDIWLYNRDVEAQLFFRNITRVDSNLRIVCPVCGLTHCQIKTK